MKRFVCSILLLIAGTMPGLAQSYKGYEYWVDDDYANRTKVNSASEQIRLTVDISKMETGLHLFNLRTYCDEGIYGGTVNNLFYIPEPQTISHPFSHYEYWFDDAYEQRQTSTATTSNVLISHDLTDFSTGLHSFNLRAFDIEKNIGGTVSSLFYIPEVQDLPNKVMSYEFWIDDDYDSRTRGNNNAESQFYTVKFDKMEPGMHFFNYRAFDDERNVGSVARSMFYIPEEQDNPNSLTSYEFWIDDNYAERVKGSNKRENQFYVVDLDELEAGIHFFNYRAFDAKKNVGGTARSMFFIPEENDFPSALATYEFWIDDDYANRTKGRNKRENQFYVVDLDDLEEGIHYFNYRAFDADKKVGSTSRSLFYVSKEADSEGLPIVGYRYAFNNVVTYVSIPETESYEMKSFSIDMPDMLDIATINDESDFTFTADAVTLNRSVDVAFDIQFKNKAGRWSTPQFTSYSQEDVTTHAVTALAVNDHVEFESLRPGDFLPIRFNITRTGAYYLHSSKPCTIDLYDANGNLINTIEHDEAVETFSTAFAKNRSYYAIVHDTYDTEGTIRIMLTDEEVLFGDVNYDGDLDEDDVEMLRDYLLGYELDDYDFDARSADLNEDNMIDLEDLVLLIKWINEGKTYNARTRMNEQPFIE